MKKAFWPLLFVFSASAAALRFWEVRHHFDPLTGLVVPAAVPLWLLPVLLVLAAACFFLMARRAAYKTPEDGVPFSFSGSAAAAAMTAGSFLLAFSAVLSFRASGMRLLSVLLLLFALASAAAYFACVLLLRRGKRFGGGLLLIPACFAAVELVMLYRTRYGSDPVLAGFYPEVLALALLCITALAFSAFWFESGKPRLFLPAAAMSVVLSFCCAFELRSGAALFSYLSAGLLSVGMLAAFFSASSKK